MAVQAKALKHGGYSSAYAIFEGGGAKGIAHIGALRALEDEKLALLGVAGTSAGAIVAALVAVGYKPDELFKDGENHILKTLQLGSPVDLLGRKPWALVVHWKRRLRTVVGLLLGGLGLSMFAAHMPATDGLATFINSSLLLAGSILIGSALICTAIGLSAFYRHWGLFDSQLIENVVNQALRRKLEEHHSALRSTIRCPRRCCSKISIPILSPVAYL